MKNVSSRRLALLLFLGTLPLACGSSPTPASPDAGGAAVGDSAAQAPRADQRLSTDGASACPGGIPFSDATGKVVVSVKINGAGPYSVFFDSGAPSTVLSTKVTGLPDGATFELKSVELGQGVTLGPAKVYSVNFGLGSSIQGILGNDLLEGKSLTIDYKRNLLRIDPQVDEAALLACAHVAKKPVTLPLTRESGYLYVAGSVQGLAGQLLLDTGASAGGISKDVLAESGLKNPVVEGLELPMSFGTFWAGYTVVGDITLGSLAVKRLAMYAQPDKMLPPAPTGRTLGVLPYPFLKHFLVTIDYPHDRLRLDPLAGDAMTEKPSLFGYGLSLSINASGPVKITRLIAGSPAEKAGLKVGDQLVSFDGKDPAALAPRERIQLVLAMQDGVPVSVTAKRDDKETTYALDSADLFVGFP
ncbi:MAG: PDZ domain-containing protein [Deltaproteobacteria bacterium]|nr:PDZ domain-containing protein [Deltaproteobacteria bacterium]